MDNDTIADSIEEGNTGEAIHMVPMTSKGVQALARSSKTADEKLRKMMPSAFKGEEVDLKPLDETTSGAIYFFNGELHLDSTFAWEIVPSRTGSGYRLKATHK